MSSAEISDKKNEKTMVVAMAVKVGCKENRIDIGGDPEIAKNTVAEMLSHLDINRRVKIEELQNCEEILAWSLQVFKSADGPVQNGFELTDDSHVYHRLRTLSTKYNQLV